MGGPASPVPLGRAGLARGGGQGPFGAQATHDGETVVSLRFEGVHNLSESTLRDVIVTEAVKCKSLFYAPLCWITDSSLFTRKPELDSAELQRDDVMRRHHPRVAGMELVGEPLGRQRPVHRSVRWYRQ